MNRRTINNVKLGLFTVAGLLFLVLLLYMIGKNQHLFGKTFTLKARFSNVQGLIAGNNVRYAGIETGTVKNIAIVNDTTIEVTMVIETEMKGVIRKNAVVSVGTEGFVGNKVVNILPAQTPAAPAQEGDVLFAKRSVSTDEMLEVLSGTNHDIAAIASELKQTVQRINNSSALWRLLNDDGIPTDIRKAAAGIRNASAGAGTVTVQLQQLLADIQQGKGSVGMLLKDSAFAKNLTAAAVQINKVIAATDSLATVLHVTVDDIHNDWQTGKGSIHALLKDTLMVNKINAIMDNVRMGTDGFNQNMEALKHNFLFRGYFKKLERIQQKEKENAARKNQH